jgi:DNA-binding beta-propeller fold protein YncE
MKIRIVLLNRAMGVILAGCIILSFSGCQEPVAEEKIFEPVFFPPPPNQPRLQFLTSYSGGENFDVAKPSFLETFVLGEAEISVGTIGQPYGVAIHKGKIYVCDVGQGNIKVIDLVNNTFSVFPSGRSLRRPVNIFIEPDGTKYIADSMGGVISVWKADDKLTAFLGKQLNIKPVDVTVHGSRLYLTDSESAQVLVLDKSSGRLLQRVGSKVADETQPKPDEFAMITDLALDSEGSIYAGDKLMSRLSKFDSDGKYLRQYGRAGSSPASIVRPKGITIDREDRIWVVDAGPASAVKVFRNDGQLLMFFGTLGNEPGQMYMPAAIVIDYDNVDLFKKYAVEGAELEFLVLVTNQYGTQKVSVYGFGAFPQSKLIPESQIDIPTAPLDNTGPTEAIEETDK